MKEKLSIIIPVYNGERYLERCMNSVLNQSYKNLEIIVVDDGSTDNSSKIYENFAQVDERITIYKQMNQGSSAARNLGLQKMTGDLVTFVDCDDWLDTEIYYQAINIYDVSKADVIDFGCVFANSYKCYPKDEGLKFDIFEHEDVLWHFLYRGLSVQNSAPYSACRKIYTKQCLDNVQFLIGKKNEDIEFNYRVCKKIEKIAIMEKVGYYYFQNQGSRTNQKLMKSDLDLLEICERMDAEETNNHYKNINSLTRAKLARSYFSILAKIAKYGCSNELNVKSLSKNLTKNLRKNWMLLMKSPVSFNRKILITSFCLSYRSPIILYSIRMRR